MNPTNLNALAVKVLKRVGHPGSITGDSVHYAALEDALTTAHLNATIAAREAPTADWPFTLAAHVANMLLVKGESIIVDESLSLSDPELVERGLTFLEGAALTMATIVIELASYPAKPSVDILSHPAATEEFRTTARALVAHARQDERGYRAAPAAGVLSVVLRKFTVAETRLVDDPFTLHGLLPPGPFRNRLARLERTVNGFGMATRLGFTFALAVATGLVGYAVGSSGDTVTVSQALPVPDGFSEVYAGPTEPNVVLRVFVFDPGTQPSDAMQSIAGVVPANSFVTGLDHRVRTEIHLGRRDGSLPVNSDLELAFGTDAGVRITPGTTTIVNRDHKNGTGADTLVTDFTPVALDNDGEVVYRFELAITSDASQFFCGYNLRPINVYVRTKDSTGLVTAMPIYILNNCR